LQAAAWSPPHVRVSRPIILVHSLYQTGEWLLVLAAAGGAGIAVIQIGNGGELERSTPLRCPANLVMLVNFVQHSARVLSLLHPLLSLMSRFLREKFTIRFAYVDAVEFIVWGGLALVVGFAGGAIENVRASYDVRPSSQESKSLIQLTAST